MDTSIDPYCFHKTSSITDGLKQCFAKRESQLYMVKWITKVIPLNVLFPENKYNPYYRGIFDKEHKELGT